MVSFWPWKGDSTSAASFEKALRSLSDKISRTNARYDRLRKNERYNKVWWTLSTGFTYIIAALILILVTGYRNWGIVEYSILAGGPPLIYGVRLILSTYYNYRITTTQDHLNNLQKQRDETIKKLKAATKYDSTQQLLDKYGGSPSSKQKQKDPSAKPKRQSTGPQGSPLPARTNTIPPPTANIRRADNPPAQIPPRSGTSPQSMNSPPDPQPASPPGSPGSPTPSASFAPNAFSPNPSQYSFANPSSDSPSFASSRSAWYDRIIDVLLGDDETQPRNRLALICSTCRLINGQAPPGTTTLGEVGRWRCGGCGAWNGEEPEREVEGMLGRLRTGSEAQGGGEEKKYGNRGGEQLRTAPPSVPPDWVDAKRGPGKMSEEELREATLKAGEDEEKAREEMSFEDRKDGLRLLDHEVGDEEDEEDEETEDKDEKTINDPPARATRSRKKRG